MEFLVQWITRECLVLYETIYQCIEYTGSEQKHTGCKLNREQRVDVRKKYNKLFDKWDLLLLHAQYSIVNPLFFVVYQFSWISLKASNHEIKTQWIFFATNAFTDHCKGTTNLHIHENGNTRIQITSQYMYTVIDNWCKVTEPFLKAWLAKCFRSLFSDHKPNAADMGSCSDARLKCFKFSRHLQKVWGFTG